VDAIDPVQARRRQDGVGVDLVSVAIVALEGIGRLVDFEM